MAFPVPNQVMYSWSDERWAEMCDDMCGEPFDKGGMNIGMKLSKMVGPSIRHHLSRTGLMSAVSD